MNTEKLTVLVSVVFILAVLAWPLYKAEPYCEYDTGAECDSLYQQRFAEQSSINGGGADLTADEQAQVDYPLLSDTQFAANMRELRDVRQEMIAKGDMLSATLVDLQRDAWITERKLAEIERLKYEESFNDRY